MRHVFLTIAAFALFLAAATCALWVSSRRPTLHHLAWHGQTTWMIQSNDGRVWLERWHNVDPMPIAFMGTDFHWRLRGTSLASPPEEPPREMGLTPFTPDRSNGFGFDWQESDLTFVGFSSATKQTLVVPYWSIAIAFSSVPAVWLLQRVRTRRRRRAGHCVACGYDLQATPARCPECGMAAAVTANLAAGR